MTTHRRPLGAGPRTDDDQDDAVPGDRRMPAERALPIPGDVDQGEAEPWRAGRRRLGNGAVPQ